MGSNDDVRPCENVIQRADHVHSDACRPHHRPAPSSREAKERLTAGEQRQRVGETATDEEDHPRVEPVESGADHD